MADGEDAPRGFTAFRPGDPEWAGLMEEVMRWIGMGVAHAYEELPPDITLETWITSTESYLEVYPKDPEAQIVRSTIGLAKAALAFRREVLRVSKEDPGYREYVRRKRGQEGSN